MSWQHRSPRQFKTFLLFPFDIAAEARVLVRADGLSCDYGVQSGAEIFSGDRNAIPGTAVVELSAVDKLERAVEEEEVRRAGCIVGAGDFLGFVIEGVGGGNEEVRPPCGGFGG